MQVVDPHIHLWDLKTHHYPWLANPQTSFVGDARDLKHDYLLAICCAMPKTSTC